MFQFNPDGSLKLSSNTLKKRQDDEDRMKRARCLRIHKEMVNFSAPKRCLLHIKLSDAITDNRFIEMTHKYFKEQAETPTKVLKINEKEFDIEIGTNFRRCSDCTTLVNRFKEFMDGMVIEEKGNCTYEGLNRNFCYEDYFE